MRWSVTRLCVKLYVRIRSLRSPVPTSERRMSALSARCFSISRSYSLERRIFNALDLFFSWDFSSWHDTTSPVGMWVMRTAGARGTEHVDAEVVGTDLDVDLLGLRNHRHRDRGGVDPPPRLRGWHPLNPVDAALVLQPAVGAPYLDHRDDFLGPAQARLAVGEHLHLPPLHRGVHPL